MQMNFNSNSRSDVIYYTQLCSELHTLYWTSRNTFNAFQLHSMTSRQSLICNITQFMFNTHQVSLPQNSWNC